ncbi:hypothetical protein M0802_016639, partial [Mischocyttarus mexicanus]
ASVYVRAKAQGSLLVWDSVKETHRGAVRYLSLGIIFARLSVGCGGQGAVLYPDGRIVDGSISAKSTDKDVDKKRGVGIMDMDLDMQHWIQGQSTSNCKLS